MDSFRCAASAGCDFIERWDLAGDPDPLIAAGYDKTPTVIFCMRFLLEVAVVAALVTLGWSKPFRDRFFTTPSTAASSPAATPSARTSHYVPRATPNPRNAERMRQKRSTLDRRAHNNGARNIAPSATPTPSPQSWEAKRWSYSALSEIGLAQGHSPEKRHHQQTAD